jgi:hypothetical protein
MAILVIEKTGAAIVAALNDVKRCTVDVDSWSPGAWRKSSRN